MGHSHINKSISKAQLLFKVITANFGDKAKFIAFLTPNVEKGPSEHNFRKVGKIFSEDKNATSNFVDEGMFIAFLAPNLEKGPSKQNPKKGGFLEGENATTNFGDEGKVEFSLKA